MPNIPSARLFDLVVLTARAMGSSPAEAQDVAEHLVAANLAGHDSHGVGMLPDYVRLLHAGLLVPNQTLETVVDRGGGAGARRPTRLRPGHGQGSDAPRHRARPGSWAP